MVEAASTGRGGGTWSPTTTLSHRRRLSIPLRLVNSFERCFVDVGVRGEVPVSVTWEDDIEARACPSDLRMEKGEERRRDRDERAPPRGVDNGRWERI